jgi:hypothetical protein
MMFKRLLDRFRKAPHPGPQSLPDLLRDSTIDWQRGDVAVCRDPGPWVSYPDHTPSRGPPKGAMCKVTLVLLIESVQFLCLKGWEGHSYHATAFDKLRGSSTSVETMIARHKSRPKTPERVDA